MGEFQEARELFQRLMNNTNSGVIKLRALRKAVASARWLGDFSCSIDLSKQAQALEDSSRLEYARVLLNEGAAKGSYGNTQDGLKCLIKAANVFEEENSLPDLAQALNESSSLYQTEGYPEKAVVTAKRAIALNEETGDFRGLVDAYFYAGQIFFNYRLNNHALEFFDKAIEISEKIGYKYRTCWAALYSAIVLDIKGDLHASISRNLLAAKYAEQTDSHYAKSQSLANLLTTYSKLGAIENAQQCYTQLKQMFPDESKAGSKLGYAALIKAQALFFSAKKDWARSDELFNLSFDLLKGALFAKSFESYMRLDYAAVLDKQSRSADGAVQREKASTLTEKIDAQFQEFSVEAILTTKKQVMVEDEFEVRLNLVNVSRISGFLVGVDNLHNSNFDICKMPTCYMLAKGYLNLKNQPIKPFQLETIRFSLKASKEGTYHFTPYLVFENQEGNQKKHKLEPISINVVSLNPPSLTLPEKAASKESIELQIPLSQEPVIGFEFKSESSSKVFNFLIASFVDDYMRSRLPVEKSGWRTLMEAVKQAKVPVSTMYGRNGRPGKTIGELQRRGLAEMRYFKGERGRGGNIMRLRICYEKEPIKRQIDLKVANYKK
jgi:tetratricopeptide (TPR) repeat protein